MNNEGSIHIVSRAVILDGAQILLAYDPRTAPNHYYELNTHFYYLPGGHIDFQESAPNALMREIKEEIGVEVEVEKFLGIIENAWNFPGDEVCCHTHEINLIFKIHTTKLKFGDKIPQKEEHVAFEWVAVEDLHRIDLRPFLLKSALLKWLESSDNNIFWSTMI